MTPSPEQLYLDLMKKTLSYALWDEPGIPIETFNHRGALLKKPLISGGQVRVAGPIIRWDTREPEPAVRAVGVVARPAPLGGDGGDHAEPTTSGIGEVVHHRDEQAHRGAGQGRGA